MFDTLELLYDRYARALYAQAQQDSVVDQVAQEIESLNELWLCDSNFRTFLSHPLISRQEKKEVMQKIMEKKHCSGTMFSFIRLIIDNNRAELVHGVCLRYRQIYESKNNKMRVMVESAGPLSSDQKQQLKKSLSKKLGRDIYLETQTNSNLIAGLYIRYGSEIFDNSLKERLNRLKVILT